MEYSEDFVKCVINTVTRECSAREVAKKLGIARSTVARWVKRANNGLPTRFTRAAKHVWNRSSEELLQQAKCLFETGKDLLQVWKEIGRKLSIRTLQRWKSKWFPKKPKEPCKRYERKKAKSLMHSDWCEKRIKDGKRIRMSFYVDDATRRLYALRAYDRATLANTACNLWEAVRETGGFRAVLTDCGKVYSKSYVALCDDNGIRSIHTRPYNPKCNGKAEAVCKKVKRFLNRFEVQSLEHTNALLREYQREYNNTPHSSLKYKTPLEVYRAKQRAGLIWAGG